jgi:glycosyltransferase involved in cell wall biosynthesis
MLPLPEVAKVLFFGRLEYYKGLDVFIEGCEIAARSLPGLRAMIAGRGSDLERARGAMTMPQMFEIRAGFIPDEVLPSVFGESSVVVLPYREASQSGVVPLAFQNGRPVIASSVGGLAEAVDDGVDGLLVPPEDPRALADAVVRLFRERGLLHKLAAGAAETVTSGRLAPCAIAQKHLDVYSEVLATRGERG